MRLRRIHPVLNSLPSPVKYLNLEGFFRSKHLATEHAYLKKRRFIAKDRLVCAWEQSDSVKTETQNRALSFKINMDAQQGESVNEWLHNEQLAEDQVVLGYGLVLSARKLHIVARVSHRALLLNSTNTCQAPKDFTKASTIHAITKAQKPETILPED
jgi:hypothetical protein